MSQIKNKHKNSDAGKTVFKAILFFVLFVYSVSIIFVLAWGLLTSLKSVNDFQYGENILGFPAVNGLLNSRNELFKLLNYQKFFEQFAVSGDGEAFSIWFGTRERLTSVNANFWTMLFNSILYSLGNAIVQAAVLSVMGYVCAKYNYKFSKVIYMTVIVVMALPIIGAYPSEITLLRDLNLYDTWAGNFIQKFTFTGMYFLVFYEYFKGTSDTYSEAAEIDGASQLTVMLKIYLPLAAKMIGSVLLVRFVFYWNDYAAVRMYMRTHPTLSYGVFWNTIARPMAGGLPLQVAACMVLALPVLVLFIAFQGKVMGSMTLGGLKE